jgi:hypothetical protein
VTAAGWLTSGRQFCGTETVKVTNNTLRYLAAMALRWLDSACGSPDWCEGVDLDQDGDVNFVDLALFNGCCIEVTAE